MSELLRIDGVLWHVPNRVPEAVCPNHHLRLKPYNWNGNSKTLSCDECAAPYALPRTYNEEKLYILNKIDSKAFKSMRVLNLDDEAIPLAEAKLSTKDNKHFVTALLTESKVGRRLVIYAGEKGASKKTQLFVEPDIKRVAFDQKDLHPSDVFVKVEATFPDGTRASIEK